MNRRGVTLIELLMAVVIGAIAMFALVPPFLAEGNLFRKGKRQTEAQRDAQMGMRAIARVGRQSLSYSPNSPGSILVFTEPVGGQACFQRLGNQLIVTRPNCVGGALGVNTTVLIDGVRSQVANFTMTPVTNKLVRVHLEVTHRLRTTDPLSEKETLETELLLRNGT